MPRRWGNTTIPVGEVWKQGEDGEWYATGRSTIKGRVTWHTRARRHRIGTKIKESNKARRKGLSG